MRVRKEPQLLNQHRMVSRSADPSHSVSMWERTIHDHHGQRTTGLALSQECRCLAHFLSPGERVFCLDGRSISLREREPVPWARAFSTAWLAIGPRWGSGILLPVVEMRITTGARPRNVIGQIWPRSAVSNPDSPLQLSRLHPSTAKDLLSRLSSRLSSLSLHRPLGHP